jgi:hypothetical protein
MMGDEPSARVDAEFLRWPTGVRDQAFQEYLDDQRPMPQ